MRAKERKTVASIKTLPPEQQGRVVKALRTLARPRLAPRAALNAGQDIIQAYSRTQAKRASDARTDVARRVLVGARVPRPMADQCRQAALSQGLSLYAWVVRALNRELSQAVEVQNDA